MKPTIKKETVRIEIPAAGAKPIPQATVKIQPAPVPSKPAQARPVQALVTTTAASVADDQAVPAAKEDSMLLIASGCVLLFAVATFVMQLLTFLAN